MGTIKIGGHFCKDCKIFTYKVEDSAMEQIRELLDNPLFRGAKMRIMPDVHAGKGIVIGYTCRVEDFVNPEHVGLDIGCGIDTEIFDRPLPEKDYALFEHRLRKEVPMGFDIHKDRQFEMKPFLKFMRQELNRAYQSSGGRIDIIEWNSEQEAFDWMKTVGIQPAVFLKSLGTLGGGNHFMEYEEGEDRWSFTVHTGSRGLGSKVFGKWNRIASAKGGYLFGNELRAYLTDMVITQAYAKYNRKLILDKAAEIMHKICGGKVDGIINTVHNYVDFRDMVLRKGAIRSYEGELMVMPFNMRDGIAICQGLSNEDWNWSAPHGSGRLMSRTQAHRQLQMKGYKEEMQGVYSTSICPETIDESPSAYKPTEDILQAITPTCKVLYRLRSKINLKGK